MKKKINSVILLLILIIIILIYLMFSYMSINEIKEYFSNSSVLKILVSLIILLFILISIIFNTKSNIKELKYRDKLFNTLIKNSDTIYLMVNSNTNKIVYLSSNIEQVLGLKIKKDKKEIVKDILNIDILRSELKSWNGKDEYISQMLSYINPKYNYQTWIKIKIYPYIEKRNSYNLIQISDVTKEHDKQHLLITQTTNIKSREKQLNQITASSYDMEININILTHTYELKYFKNDMLYFGQERKGNFNNDFKEIVNEYINSNDIKEILNTISIENFNDHVANNNLEPISIRYRLGNKIKDNIWLESTIFFIQTKDRVDVSVLTKNVTENAESIREQNILLQNSLNEAKLANEAKVELISTISHDIRTPMTTIKGLSESLSNKELSNDIKEDIININESSNEVLDIINGLLDVSKIEKKNIKKEEKNYNLFELFNNIENNMKEYIGTKNIDFILDMDTNLPVILHGDSKRINQVLSNIINNSIKYTEEGQIKINVIGKKILNNINLIITVKDTGCGISEEKLTTIFEKNSKSNNNGLKSIKNIIDLLGGTIEIESKVNEYTEVTISLTQKIVEDNKIREMMQHNSEAQTFNLKGKRVLLVDDNRLNLKVTKRMLETYELSIDAVESGIECIDYIKENNNYNLILLDIMMPGMDGIATLNKLKEDNSFNTPVIALTADAMVGQKEKYLNSGFNDYLSKPIDKIELSRILKEYLKGD